MSDINILLKCIQDGVLLSSGEFANVNSEAILVARDQPAFENNWLTLFNKVKNSPLSQEQAAEIERVRELAFKAIFSATSNPDLSGYVSDDFEVISKGIIFQLQDDFLNGLLKSYAEGRVPAGTDISSQDPLNNTLSKLRDRLP